MMNAEQWEQNWYTTGLVLLMVSLVFYALNAFRAKTIFHEGGWGSMLLATLCFIGSLAVRSLHAKYFALSNMYESLLTLSIGIQIAFLAIDRWFKLRYLGLPVSVLLLTSLFYDLHLPTSIHPLQPALQSYWRSIHVPIILLSYALFTLAFLSSLVYLVAERFSPSNKPGNKPFNKAAGLSTSGLTLSPAGVSPEFQPHSGQSSSFPPSPLNTPSAGNQQALASYSGSTSLEMSQPPIYDEITYRCVAFGFPLLTLGIILGGIWANEAWGNYWSWDPKESMSLVTLLGYGVYLHLRVNGEHSPRTLAWVSVTGFALMLVTYFGVNLMGVGLHSYGRIG